MWDDESDLSQIRENVKRRLRYRRSPITVVILAVVVSMIVANVLSVVGQRTDAFPVWFPGIIALLIAIRIISSRLGSRAWRRRSDRSDDEIDRAVRRELRRQGYMNDRSDTENGEYDEDDYLEKAKRGVQPAASKHKNDAHVRLGDDGELIFDEESPEESEMTSQNF